MGEVNEEIRRSKSRLEGFKEGKCLMTCDKTYVCAEIVYRVVDCALILLIPCPIKHLLNHLFLKYDFLSSMGAKHTSGVV